MAITLGQLDILIRAAEGDNFYPEINQVHLALSSGLFGGKVLDKDLTTPPAGTDENLYIVGPAASGAWSGEDGNLAVYDGGATAWQFIPKREGMLVWVADEDELYVYTGSAWAIFESGGGASAIDELTDVDTSTTPPNDGDVLTWDSGGSEWVPVAIPAGDDGVIYDNTLGGTAATIDTGASGIPAGYDVLQIWMLLRTDESATNSTVNIRVNNDSGANYDWQVLSGNNTTAGASIGTAQTEWRTGCTGATAASGVFTVSRMTFPAYAQTTAQKVGELTDGNADPTAATRRSTLRILHWRDTSAITRFAVSPASGNFIAGSRLLIIGYPNTGVGGGGATSLDGLDDVDTTTTPPSTGDVLTYDGAGWVPAAPDSTAAPSSIFVTTTGNDTTGDGSVGNPYLTVGKAISILPNTIAQTYTIDVGNGTYDEALNIGGLVCTGDGKLVITGDTATPSNVSFTGNASRTTNGETRTACIYIDGHVTVELEGIQVNETCDFGTWAVNGSRLILDRTTHTGTLSRGVVVAFHSFLELQGSNTITGFSGLGGIEIGVNSAGQWNTSAGTLTITGANTTGTTGFHVYQGSTFSIYGNAPSACHITITSVKIGFQVGLTSIFTHQGPSATITVDNASKPANSAGIQCTDMSSWSTPNTLVLDNLTIGHELNSLSYSEATGTRTYTNLTSTSSATQNSVYYAP